MNIRHYFCVVLCSQNSIKLLFFAAQDILTLAPLLYSVTKLSKVHRKSYLIYCSLRLNETENVVVSVVMKTFLFIINYLKVLIHQYINKVRTPVYLLASDDIFNQLLIPNICTVLRAPWLARSTSLHGKLFFRVVGWLRKCKFFFFFFRLPVYGTG